MLETLKGKLTPAGSNKFEGTANEEGDVAGFWQGLWHGMIAPISFFTSLFKEDVGIYEVHNNGRWYNFGFVLGLSVNFSSKGVKISGKKGGSGEDDA